MGDKMLLFKDSHLDWFAEKADGLVFKKGPVDVVDKPVFRLAFGMLNKAVSPKIPDEFIPSFQEALDRVVEGDYDDAAAEALDVVIELVDLLKVGDGVKEIITGVLNIAKGALAGID